MTQPPVIFPDVERLVVDHLKNRPELTGVVVDNRTPPDFDGTQRTVLVSRSGGTWVEDLHLDQPLIDLEVYGPDKPTAHTLAMATRTALLTVRGTTYGTAYVTDVAETEGPRWLPDHLHAGASRYFSTTRLFVRPA
ncbi:hypothetical protein AQ490_18505 [Wenjunlia vitaminophila]|uniref:Uncharacterized protein n=1 Tax=Wenjunlia vitaminophila TaxID=76728 RepID=A0A0T6LU44_WENVI|nr:hypothetical protein [Wenjunlia vitaminophila]KRV49703.1 hypothetical protein AQ490_18505 [Wenjunlia vitaminophila]